MFSAIDSISHDIPARKSKYLSFFAASTWSMKSFALSIVIPLVFKLIVALADSSEMTCVRVKK